MYSKDMWEVQSIENKLYMQIQEWFFDLYYRDTNEYMKNSSLEKIENNLEELKKLHYQENLIKDIEERLSEYYGITNRVVE